MMLNLSYGIKFEDLYNSEHVVDKAFLNFLHSQNIDLYNALIYARSAFILEAKKESDLIIALAPILEDFISSLFNITNDVDKLCESHSELSPLYSCKRLFIQRVVSKTYTIEMVGDINKVISELRSHGLNPEDELAFATAVNSWESHPALELAKRYAAWALFSEDGKKKHKNGVLFKLPSKIDYENLLPQLSYINGAKAIPEGDVVLRDGFNNNDPVPSLQYALSNSNYCILCHNQGKDSCSKGAVEYKENPLGVKMTGCPLEEKISEMNTLKNQACPIGALATAIIDNPMIAGTGHRICNDCMKSCIYQKQEPVDIPSVESRVLYDVLLLPWGFEIYSLLTRWNPLNFRTPLPLPISEYKTLVVGLGPSGFTLSHYLLNQGVNVVAIDGLKIEPIDSSISGIDQHGNRCKFNPILDIKTIFEPLSERNAQGFGGVAEYGITIRWDKNYLKIIRLLLERRKNFRMYGGIRFGSNISTKDAFNIGFDHIALAMGAGRPNLPKIPNILANGVRTASDFLMTLQLSGANKYDSITNLTLNLPVVVIGGGLTAIDTATESIAYYIFQVEKLLRRYEELGDDMMTNLSLQEREMINTQLEHALQLRSTDAKIDLIRKWGGVKVVYRRSLKDSPSYRLNHEEVAKAMEEGVEFIENIVPESISVDEFGNCIGVKHQNGFISAKSIFVAIGTSPNTVISKEENGYELEGNYFKLMNISGDVVTPEKQSKNINASVLHNVSHGNGISFFGDLHPSYSGNVVKAMASAKNGYPQIIELLDKAQAKCSNKGFFEKLDNELLSFVDSVNILTANIVEIVIRSPQAARLFQPGQFYRLQNYSDSSILAMEPIALTGAWSDPDNGLLGLIVLEMGGSSDLCRYLKKGEAVVLMGPTGSPTEIPKNENVMLVGGGLGNAVLFSIGKAMRNNGCDVLYFAGYKKLSDVYKVDKIEDAADQLVWCCDEGVLKINRPHDLSFHSNIVEAIKLYGISNPERLKNIDRIIVIGSDKMMKAVAFARHNSLKEFFKTSHVAIGSINSPMQCMMKEICGQCLQRNINPVTGEENYVFSCFNQDQNLDCVDFENLSARLGQNSAQEKITSKWISKKTYL
jgi:NADPH-dependent glutamate synthase beta subunit-like oxidoreductase/NAD(P)H-flavin reductase